jgi:repressor LexA
MEEELKKLIIEKYGSIRKFAIKIDIPYTTIDSILKRGIDNSNVSNVIKICKALNISLDQSLNENRIINNLSFDNADIIDFDDDIIKIPVFGTIKAGIPIESQSDIIDYVEIPKIWTRGGKKFYGLKISGDSMFPKYNEDDIVIFEQNDDTTLYHGKDVAIMINGTESTFKKLLVNEQGIVLQPYNTGYDIMMFSKEDVEQLPIKVVGIAREKRTRID